MTTLNALASVSHKARTPFSDPRTLASLRHAWTDVVLSANGRNVNAEGGAQ